MENRKNIYLWPISRHSFLNPILNNLLLLPRLFVLLHVDQLPLVTTFPLNLLLHILLPNIVKSFPETNKKNVSNKRFRPTQQCYQQSALTLAINSSKDLFSRLAAQGKHRYNMLMEITDCRAVSGGHFLSLARHSFCIQIRNFDELFS